MECSRNGRCGKGQHIHIFLQGFNPLLIRYTEALFLIHDEESQILKMDILGKKTMGSYRNIRPAVRKLFQTLLQLLPALKTGKKANPHRKPFHSFYKIVVNLLGKYRRWTKIRHLFGILHGLKRCSKSNLGLSVAHISTNQTIHDFFTFHVFFGRFNG